MADEFPDHSGARRRGLKGEVAAIAEDLERTKAAGLAKVSFDIAERLIILTGITFAEHRAPAVARGGLFVLKIVLSSIFVFWLVTPLARSVMRMSRAVSAKIEAYPLLRRALTVIYFAIVVVLAVMVSRMLNYFLSYLSPAEG